MKRNSNNNRNESNDSRYTRKAVENLKAMIKADDLEALTLAVYGIQIYASYLTGEEYTVIMKAERDIMTGRYYFITREGVRIAWSRLDLDTLIHAAVDFMDRVEELEAQAAREVENLEKYENTVIDSDVFFYYVRRVLDIMGINWKFTAHYITNDGRTADGVKIERPATRKPSEPVRHWLHTRPAEELAEMKADRIRKADALHKAGHFAAAVYASQLCGMISDEQTARRADDIVKARESAKTDRIRKAAELLPVGGVEIENETRTASIVVCGDERVRLAADEMRQARHLIETARELAQIETTEQAPATDPTDTRASYKVLAVVAIRLTDPATTTEPTTRRGREYVEIRWPFGCCLLNAEDYQKARRIADHLTDTPAPTKGEGDKATESHKERETPAEGVTTKADNSEAVTANEKTHRAAPIIAAALFLLSLTIGTGTPARIYTHDPAAVLAEVAAAGEVVTAYDIAEA